MACVLILFLMTITFQTSKAANILLLEFITLLYRGDWTNLFRLFVKTFFDRIKSLFTKKTFSSDYTMFEKNVKFSHALML